MMEDASKSYAELLREITQNAKNFLSSEIELIKVEAKTVIKRVGSHSVALGIGMWLTVFAPLGLLTAAAIALGDYWGGRYWLSTLVISALALTTGLACIYTAVQKIKKAPVDLKSSKKALEKLSNVAKQDSRDLSYALKGGTL
jgi:uncharacterized membrane protein YqjE